MKAKKWFYFKDITELNCALELIRIDYFIAKLYLRMI